MKSVFETMGGTYRKCGDFFIPEMALPDTEKISIGKYGRMRQRYLKEHRGVLYNAMILDGTLWSHHTEVDKICKERMDGQIKEDFHELYLLLNGMPPRDMDKIINPICTLCRDHEQSGFIHGVQVGVRLAREIME